MRALKYFTGVCCFITVDTQQITAQIRPLKIQIWTGFTSCTIMVPGYLTRSRTLVLSAVHPLAVCGRHIIRSQNIRFDAQLPRRDPAECEVLKMCMADQSFPWRFPCLNRDDEEENIENMSKRKCELAATERRPHWKCSCPWKHDSLILHRCLHPHWGGKAWHF